MLNSNQQPLRMRLYLNIGSLKGIVELRLSEVIRVGPNSIQRLSLKEVRTQTYNEEKPQGE